MVHSNSSTDPISTAVKTVQRAFAAFLELRSSEAHARELDPSSLHATGARWVLRATALGLAGAAHVASAPRDVLLADIVKLVDVEGIDALSCMPGQEETLAAILRQVVQSAAQVLDCATQRGDASAWLGQCYEALLSERVTLRMDAAGNARWVSVPGRRGRKGTGSFYTPSALTGPTVERTLTVALEGCVEPQYLRVLDPAMGAGALLVAALRFLSSQVDLSPREIAKRALYGVDRDPIAVELARLAIWLEVGDPSLCPDALCPGLKLGDALVGTTTEEGADYPHAALCRPRLKGTQSAHHHPIADWRRAWQLRRLGIEVPSDGVEDSGVEDLDRWCALWFWPVAEAVRFPTQEGYRELDSEQQNVVSRLKKTWRFFHWHLAFPEVFDGARPGFDAVFANPPWETLQPESKAFFEEVEPGFSNLNRKAAQARRDELCAQSPALERRWIDYIDGVGALSAFFKRPRSGGLTFEHQGSGKPHLHKLFVERCYDLCRSGGALGLIIPSAIATDYGAEPLRRLLFEHSELRWLYGFENRDRLFDIHRSYKFSVLIARKGGKTDRVSFACLRHTLSDWNRSSPKVMSLSYEAITAISPMSLSVVESESSEAFSLLERFSSSCVTLGDEAWSVDYAQGDFNMTGAARHFLSPESLRQSGFVQQRSGLYQHPDGRTAHPVIQGVMVGLLRPNRAAYISGTGARAAWDKSLGPAAPITPQYAILGEVVRRHAPAALSPRFVFRSIARNTDTRTLIGAVIGPHPTGHSLSRLALPACPERTFILSMVLTSLVFDWQVRARIVGTNMSKAFISELRVPDTAVFDSELGTELDQLGRLLQGDEVRAPEQCPEARRALRVRAECLVAEAYGLSADELALILRDCGHSCAALRDKAVTRRLDPKGFWRVDRTLAPRRRLTSRVLDAFGQAKP